MSQLQDLNMSDYQKTRVSTHAVVPKNADEAAKPSIPIVLYPELATTSNEREGYRNHATAGLDAFDLKDDSLHANNNNISLMALPIPTGFFEAIVSTHIACQDVDYLPQVPNLPLSRGVGRFKPRSAAMDWLAISFDPWSAGKSPLNTEFIPSLTATVDLFSLAKRKVGISGVLKEGDKPKETIISMQQRISKDAFVNVNDDEGDIRVNIAVRVRMGLCLTLALTLTLTLAPTLTPIPTMILTLTLTLTKTLTLLGLAEANAAVSLDQILQEEFKKLTSLCRHSKFSEVEDLLNQADWRLPIDYQDASGNTILHVVVQNGNKRLTKLCLRRGASINLQNIYGQTPLHFAFGFGYTLVGEYLVSKGADETVRNKDDLTCYEGMAARDLDML
jgi:hypothetical protein